MAQILIYMILGVCFVAAFLRPWIGVVFCYLVVILVPQDIWWWDFNGVRPILWVILPTAAGFAGNIMGGKFDLTILKNRRNLFLLLLWIATVISYYVGPYVYGPSPYRWRDPAQILSIVNKIFFLYFVACVCINDERRLKYLVLCLVVSAVYLTYWANDQYLTGKQIGRIAGPSGLRGFGVYADENGFALLFVVAVPYLYYLGFYFRNAILRCLVWSIIPFCWHAVFLTGSRGALLGICVTIILTALRSPKRAIGLLVVPLFIVGYVWQAGDLMKSRAGTIGEYRTEESAATRLEAWEAARSMMFDYPITGVGLASFGAAFPDHSDKEPREAHNTFFQIGAESGVFAGVLYALLVMSLVVGLWKNGKRIRKSHAEGSWDVVYLVNEATLISVCGIGVCSMFLSLQLSELLYYLFLVGNSTLFISGRVQAIETVSERVEMEPEPELRFSSSPAGVMLRNN